VQIRKESGIEAGPVLFYGTMMKVTSFSVLPSKKVTRTMSSWGLTKWTP